MQCSDSPIRFDWPRKINEIPKEVFVRADIYREEIRRIFHGPEWHPLAHVSELPEPGDFKTLTIGATPVIVMHGDDGQIRVFANTCPHRGTQLETASRGHARSIECPYHRWAFNTRGELMGAPGVQEFPASFRKQDYGMWVLRSAQFCGMVFATLDANVAPLDEYLGETREYIARAFGGDGNLRLLGYQKVSFATNWKEYSDNEGYHAPLLHRAFRLLKWQGGAGSQFMTSRAHKVIAAELSHAPDSGFLHDHSLIEVFDKSKAPQSIVVSLFPVSLILHHLDVITVRYALPVSQDETEVHYTYFARADDSPELLQHRVRQASNLLGPSGLISLEDGAVFNRLHVGARTGGIAAFQKGVQDNMGLPTSLKQNDEAGNLVRWERYRQAMGFERV
ncbi:MAG: Rieske 2Fe-2S domain-containing protein [Burkholderiales bacterium]|nr:Rieske 2Fe-2S domain-containing protein [Burkholderiales bacterium]ODU66840.1 MAG: (2Fe-2S)-binding protein [Lautropia sp. SCN 66-9]